MRSSIGLVVISLLVVFPGVGAVADADADLVLRNGKIVTVDAAHGTVEAIAVRDGLILDVGSDEAMAAHTGDATRVIDLEGRLAVPGFIEGHGHFIGLGEARMSLDLTRARSWQEIVDIVAEAVQHTPPHEWIIGRGWHQEKWDAPPPDGVEGFPIHDELSAVSPDNPVLLTHASGHACCANGRAMELANISGSTPDPPGGEILRDAGGQPIGVFRETAASLVSRVMTSRVSPEALRRRAIALATSECLAKGVTSFQDAGSTFAGIDTMRALADDGALGVRLWVMIRESNDVLRERVSDYRGIRRHGGGMLTVGGVKRSIDGALGSRGAWLLEPYTDSPESKGLETASVESVTESARLALANDLQFCVHAIGDRANREVLDICERVLAGVPDGKDRRWRIEHAQHLHPDDIPRFAELGVIASMQGVHCTSDAPWVIARLGADRARDGAYVWQKLKRSGAIVSNGTDTPVEDVNPIACYDATVTRRLADGTQFYPDQCMTRMEALESYTIDAAYAAFEEDMKGSLTPGKYADIVVLSQDLLTVPDNRIRETEVLLTIVGGKIAHDAR